MWLHLFLPRRHPSPRSVHTEECCHLPLQKRSDSRPRSHALPFLSGKALLRRPAGWDRSRREPGDKVGAASLTSPPRDPEPGSPSGSFLPVLARDPPDGEFGSVLPRPGQAWDRAGWYLGCGLAGHHPGWQALYRHPSSPSFQKLLDLTPVGCPKRLCKDLLGACEIGALRLVSTY